MIGAAEKARWKMRKGRISTALAVLLIAGCDRSRGDEEAQIYDTRPPIEVGPDTTPAASYAEELAIDLPNFQRTPTGLYVEDVVVGTGEEATSGQTAVVHYTGWLPDGTKFDASRDRGEPFGFPLGAGRVIAGWDEGVAGMRVGGRRRLVIPPHLGYGAEGAGDIIPPNSTLVFDVELLELR